MSPTQRTVVAAAVADLDRYLDAVIAGGSTSISAARAAVAEIHYALKEPGWRPIEDAPKGVYSEKVTDEKWVEPPKLLLVVDGELTVGYWDWYYADGGYGYSDGRAWVRNDSGEPCSPTHYMPLPAPPEVKP